MLLAYSQRADVLPRLRDALKSVRDREEADNLSAAIDAIENGNQDLFIDRDHSGMVKLTIG